MPVHGRALSKSFLVYKRIMDGNMANQQSALPDPKATCDPATEEIVDIEFELLDVENDIVAVATVLAERARSVTSLREYLLPPDRLSALGPANRLKLLQKHLSRLQKQLTPDSHHPAEVRNGSNIARSESVCSDSAPGAHKPSVPPLLRMPNLARQLQIKTRQTCEEAKDVGCWTAKKPTQ